MFSPFAQTQTVLESAHREEGPILFLASFLEGFFGNFWRIFLKRFFDLSFGWV
jgi:hypothetical protein